MRKPKELELALRENVFGDDIPFIFDHFERPQCPPYAAYMYRVETIKADNIVVHKVYEYSLELYSEDIEEDIESAIELFLTENGIAFNAETLFVPEEQLFLTLYTFAI